MKANTKIFAFIMTLFLLSCSSDYIDQSNETTTLSDSYLSKNSNSKNSTSILWDFNDLTGWEDATQVGLPNYWLENGNLTVFTNPNTWEITYQMTKSRWNS